MATVSETLELAVRHHQAGRLESAEKLYHEIVRLDPRHADALHLLGIASHQRNENQTAVEYISRAIAVDGSAAIYHSNLGAAYQALGDTRSAIECFHEALRISPNYPDAWHNLAAVLHAARKLEAAAAAYRELIRVGGNDPRHRMLLAAVLRDIGRPADAIKEYRLAVEAQPDFAEAHFALGVALRGVNQLDEATKCFETTIALQPRHSRAHNNLGSALHDRGDIAAAMKCYTRALDLDANYADAHCNLGTALRAVGRFDDAIQSYRKAIFLRPDFADAWFNLGNVQRDIDGLEDAAECYRRTIALVPEHVKARVNLGVTLKGQRKLDAALAEYQAVLETHPKLAEAHFNRSLIWLMSGDFIRGWDEYEWRWQHDPQPRRFSLPGWNGESLLGRKVLVTAEQGLGDEIMFSSCLAEMIAVSALCVVECDRRLRPLFERSLAGATIVVRGEASQSAAQLAGLDFQIPCGTLPRFFRRRLADFPKRRSWLVPDAQKCERWIDRLSRIGDGLKVGISWFGGKDQETRRKRSAPLIHWRDVLATRGVQFVSLQYGDTRRTLAELRREFGVTVHAWEDLDPLREIDDFAALVASLDLVLSVDNSTVHLAGAVGTPVWTLLPYASDWRWMLETEDSPWYPSMRLFRQRAQGDWPELFSRVSARLPDGTH